MASVKLDGLTVRLTYKDGDLLLAESRGNGTVGSDITEHVKQFSNVPLHINKEGTYVIDGEALIKLNDFAEINKNGEYKNSRNLAAGTLSSLDTSVVKDRKLSWYAWEVVEGDNNNSFYLRLLNAQILGFDVVPCCDVTVDNFSELQICIDNFINIASISPFSSKNLPKSNYTIPESDLAQYKSVISDVPKDKLLSICHTSNNFIKTLVTKQNPMENIKADMKLKGLKGKEYVHSIGQWDNYINYLRKELSK